MVKRKSLEQTTAEAAPADIFSANISILTGGITHPGAVSSTVAQRGCSIPALKRDLYAIPTSSNQLMAYRTLSENIVAALITAADGVLTLPLGDAMSRLEAWQHRHNCHFGTCRSDVSASIRLLWFEDLALFNLCPESCEEVDQLGFSEVLPVLLNYKHWYANDEASYWDKASTRQPANDKPPLQSMSFRSFRMQQYLATSIDLESDQLLQALGKLGLDEKYLQSCARPGHSS